MPRDLNPGLEVIAYQSSDFFVKLTDKFEQWRTSAIFTPEEANRLGIAALIEDATGLSVRVDVEDSFAPNAMVRIPEMDKNHPMLINFMRAWHTNDDMHKISKLVNDKFTGIIDRRNGKVAGHFSKITAPIYFTKGLLEGKKFTAAQIAAICLHELGHLFTFFERIIDVTSINYAAWTATQRILKTEADVDRIQILTDYTGAVSAELRDAETIIQGQSEEAIFIHLVTETIKNRRNEEGDMIYAYRGYEFSCDQFAARHGAGKDLVGALDLIYREQFLNPSYISWPTHVAIQIIASAFVIWACSVNIRACIMIVIGLLAARPMNKVYDDPKERMERIRRELVGNLKLKLSDERRRQTVSDIAGIDTMMKAVNDKPLVLEAVWKYLIPTGRANHAKMEFQKSLERLGSNDLFLQSAKIENLA